MGLGGGVSAVRRWDCAGGMAQGASMPPGGLVGTPHWGPQCHRGGRKAAAEHSCCGCRAVGLPIRHCSMLGHGGLHRPSGTSAQAAAVATLISGCVLSHLPRNPAAAVAVLSEGDPNHYRQGGGLRGCLWPQMPPPPCAVPPALQN